MLKKSWSSVMVVLLALSAVGCSTTPSSRRVQLEETIVEEFLSRRGTQELACFSAGRSDVQCYTHCVQLSTGSLSVRAVNGAVVEREVNHYRCSAVRLVPDGRF